ncbi:hypothetical protein A3K29_01020 [Candidatus Collierbacteria bacterium RIFOXYB2_FULL_46_14]|uniref:Uncharacterized protein n=1 Tax=Candidatus Collierbacteria bacterium GW2011_GWA2_46_26 TaxID=1618381 RepID=A0A0G1RTK2_9BACT|nr:MAG: hypothetical protein UW29_C0003G0035 [Candidatus Collierbacteria bacterium GW2011_GWC2_44_13]KKU33293.1 MAG: hypothetical protein UX47_C0005G0095 [Candidatus Collierbacteria bacterium GW2011_GWA2_46_26]OGD72713.1 MAG: hypothetical protein A3K29_01020 [Candidatus Collierbacteria bacterium RIFOXYB2_FULL_46_14]OGD75755.1 MAG: hypothetical protein A3K43_01020 [Candidatus Collierbacteria bacterium RIFOXYA2_FULL_46_20]OGD77091.1 MAG: hypothetical protein A3K39_01020 [Candidatus Collierbacteri
MRSLQKHLSLIFLFLFTLTSIVFVPQVRAATSPTTNTFGVPGVKTLQDYVKEFCDKRSGDLMNLETWYSGKCGPTVDTLSGDGVGFVDIVILQGMEWVNALTFNSPGDSYIDSVKRQLEFLQAIKDALTASTNQTNLNDIAFMSIKGSGLLDSAGRAVAGLATTRPASSIDYVAYVSSNLRKHKVIGDTYAAGPGYGFTALAPILPLWRAFRNIAYLLFALGFVLYGIMIMFRVKIDSKTAATIQLAIPKLIATLLMITFSYAIVGFLVDISTIADAMAISILRAGGILNSSGFGSSIGSGLVDVVSGQTIFGAIGSFLINTVTAVIISPFLFFNLLLGGLAGIIVAVFVSGLSMITGLGIIVSIIIIIAIAISYFKLILKLFQAFFGVIINLIFAPIILLGNLLPGSTSFGDWLRSIYGNLAVFPVAIFFLTMSYALMCQPLLSLAGSGGLLSGVITAGLENLIGVNQLSTLSNIWTPPLTIPGGQFTSGGATTGTATGSVGSLMLGTIGFGLLLMSSKYCEMVEKALKTPPFPYGAAIGEALKTGVNLQDKWAQSGYKLPAAKYTAPISSYLRTTPGLEVKPTVDALTKDV